MIKVQKVLGYRDICAGQYAEDLDFGAEFLRQHNVDPHMGVQFTNGIWEMRAKIFSTTRSIRLSVRPE